MLHKKLAVCWLSTDSTLGIWGAMHSQSGTVWVQLSALMLCCWRVTFSVPASSAEGPPADEQRTMVSGRDSWQQGVTLTKECTKLQQVPIAEVPEPEHCRSLSSVPCSTWAGGDVVFGVVWAPLCDLCKFMIHLLLYNYRSSCKDWLHSLALSMLWLGGVYANALIYTPGTPKLPNYTTSMLLRTIFGGSPSVDWGLATHGCEFVLEGSLGWATIGWMDISRSLDWIQILDKGSHLDCNGL